MLYGLCIQGPKRELSRALPQIGKTHKSPRAAGFGLKTGVQGFRACQRRVWLVA